MKSLRYRFLWAIASLCVLAAAQSPAATKWEEAAGKLLHSETIEEKNDFYLVLDSTAIIDRQLALRLRLMDAAVVRERDVYEKVNMLMVRNGEQWEPVRPLRVELIPNEYVYGEERVRQEKRDLGFLTEQTIQVNGAEARTDEDGWYVDKQQIVLSLFDSFPEEAEFTVTHPQTGAQGFSIERSLFFELMGVFQEAPRPTAREDLHYELDYPETVEPGETFAVTLKSKNDGSQYMCNIGACMFSRHPWLNLKNFYIGELSSGQSRRFTRLFTVPEDAAPGKFFGVVGIWDNKGAVAKHRQKFMVEIKAAPAEEAAVEE